MIANHALLMVQAARAAFGTGDERTVPTRYVLDEGHHIFDAADSAFAAHLTGSETRELRRWLLGPETRGRGGADRARGLGSRIGDLIGERDKAREAMEAALQAARALPANEWHQRLAAGAPQGACERFLALVRGQVLARVPEPRSGYSLEAPVQPLAPGLDEAARSSSPRRWRGSRSRWSCWWPSSAACSTPRPRGWRAPSASASRPWCAASSAA